MLGTNQILENISPHAGDLQCFEFRLPASECGLDQQAQEFKRTILDRSVNPKLVVFRELVSYGINILMQTTDSMDEGRSVVGGGGVIVVIFVM